MELQFRVTKQSIKRTDGQTPVSDSVNYLTAEFTFDSSDWDNTTKTATFRSGVSVYTVILDSNNKCVVPWELIRAGKLKVSVYGDGANEYRITADSVDVPVYASGFSLGEESQHPTPDQYEQLTGALAEKVGVSNLKTINGNSLVGEGDIIIEGGGASIDDVTATTYTVYSSEKVALMVDAKPSINDEEASTASVYSSAETADLLALKLGSGDLKTINNQSIVGSGNIEIEGGTADVDERDITSRFATINEGMTVTNITSENDVYLYDNDNLAIVNDRTTTSKDVTCVASGNLITLNGTASGYVAGSFNAFLPEWLVGQRVVVGVEVVSGSISGAFTVKLPFKYINNGTETQAIVTNSSTKLIGANVSSLVTGSGNLVINITSGITATNCVIRVYIGLRTFNNEDASNVGLPTAHREVVTSVSNKNGNLISCVGSYTAHVKSKEMLPKLFGKRIVLCGDSVAFGAKGKSFGQLVAENEGTECEVHAISGARLSNGGTVTPIVTQITNLTLDYDYIVLDGGGNDMSYSANIGSLSTGFDAELDDTTVIGATEKVCKFLITNYPNAKKLFVLIHRITTNLYLLKPEQTTYFDAIISALEKWGIPYVDLREFPLCAYNADFVATYFNTTDFASYGGLHPSTAGYKLGYVDQVQSKLESI